jgi:hypothetical protein
VISSSGGDAQRGFAGVGCGSLFNCRIRSCWNCRSGKNRGQTGCSPISIRRKTGERPVCPRFSSVYQFNEIRNTVAHSCELNDDEITRFKLLVKDWFRIQS